jgi:predicted alpha/beta hydrolase
MNATSITFAARDGTTLSGTHFEPIGTEQCAILLAGALAIHHRFYAPFAQWLSERGHRVMTFDLRGMGASRAPQHARSLRGLSGDMLTWAQQDFAAAIEHLCGVAKRDQITVIGHSLGAHHAGMTSAKTQQRIDKLISVAAGAGYWRDWAPHSRFRAPMMIYFAAPLLTPLFGYFPGKRLGMVGDLPAGVVRQWSHWCRHPDFAWGAEPERVRPNLETAQFPIHALSFTDDETMTEMCTRKLLLAYINCPSELQRVSPASLGLTAIGHLGAFRKSNADVVWPLIEHAIH